jgi:cell division protein FtsB
MKKSYIEINIDNKTIDVCEVKECEPLEFVKLKEEAKKNRLAYIFAQNQKIKSLEDKVANLEQEINHLKGED